MLRCDRKRSWTICFQQLSAVSERGRSIARSLDKDTVACAFFINSSLARQMERARSLSILFFATAIFESIRKLTASSPRTCCSSIAVAIRLAGFVRLPAAALPFAVRSVPNFLRFLREYALATSWVEDSYAVQYSDTCKKPRSQQLSQAFLSCPRQITPGVFHSPSTEHE
jgi:hypothetical protein